MNHVDTSSINHISLCSGYGGIDLGLKRAVGERLCTVAYVEIEAFAAANLVAKAEAGLLDAAPVWSDLRSFPWGKFHGLVDILSGGYPCQPFSAAGKRRGHEDPRHLWPAIAAGIAAMRPGICFFENVEGHISLGLRDVLHDLGELGYRATWGIFSASEVGAPHQRKRVFIMAHRNGDGLIRNVARATALTFGDRSQDGVSGADGELAHRIGSRPQGLLRPIEMEVQGKAEPIRPAGTGRVLAWPSRPGEPQHGWEPPRVIVGDAKSQRNGQRSEFCGEECGSGGALPRDVEQSGQAMANAEHGREDGASAQMGGKKSSEDERESEIAGTAQTTRDGCAGAMGDAPSTRRPRPKDTGTDRSDAGQGPRREESERAGLLGHPNSTRPQERTGQRGSGIQGANADGGADADRQTQPALGGDADGPAGGLGYAKLCVSVDNRTDELRLLGNGVVPATAERAFRTLWEELLR